MNYHTAKYMTQHLNIDLATAKVIRGLMVSSIDPESVDATEQWVRQCYHRPSDAELIMHAIDAMLENHGVEYINERYAYSNTGDSYAATIIYDNETGRYAVGSWGDLVERKKLGDTE